MMISESLEAPVGESRRNAGIGDNSGPGMSDLASDFIGFFGDLDINSAPLIEPAFLDPLVAQGDLINISGPAGCGKTTLLADILIGATCPQREGSAWGGVLQFTPQENKPIKCAIIDAETSIHRWNSILKKRKLLAEGLPSGLPLNIRYAGSRKFGLSAPAERRRNSVALAEALYWDQRNLVVIDTLAAAWSPDNINDPQWVYDAFDPFRIECKQYGITIIALTHTRRKTKDDPGLVGPMGTSAQENVADTQLIVTRLPSSQPHGVSIRLQKARRAPWIQQGACLELRFDSASGYKPIGDWENQWPRNPILDDQGLGSATTASKVESLIQSAYPKDIGTADIAASLGISQRTVRDHIRFLTSRGLVTKVGNGPKSKWRWAQ